MEESNRTEESQDIERMDRRALIDRIRELEREFSENQKTARELAESEERYDLALRGTHDGIWNWDLDSNLVTFSPRFNALLGYPEDRAIGEFSEFTSCLHPDDLKATMEAVRAHLEEKVPYNVEYRLRHKNGEYKWFQARGEAARDENGKPIRMAGAIADITRRKEIEQQLKLSSERFRIATRAGGIGVFDYDIVNNILVWDEEMYRIYGVDPEQFSGAYEAWEEGVHPDDLPAERRKLESAMRGEKEFDSEFRIIWPSDGSIHYINANATVQRDKSGKAIRMIGANWDITESRQTLEELRIAREKAESAAEAKSRFLANMSHEIRTPLNGIIGLGELLQRTRLDRTQLEYVNLINQSSESLRAIVDDVLDFSKIEAGMLSLDLQEFPLRDTIADILQTLAFRAAKKGLELCFRVDPKVPDVLAGDPGRIRQVLLNLAGNGIKFTSEGEVKVTVGLESIDDGYAVLHFRVQDTGIGIPPEKQESIFESFTQAESSTTQIFGGTGLGLSISRSLVELMGGQIRVESKVGQGSTFHFTNRLEVIETAPEGIPDIEKLEGKPVLVVVDAPSTNGEILEEILLNWGMKPQVASGKAHALELLSSSQKSGQIFPFVILDVDMPEGGCTEAAAAIRGMFNPDSLEILVIGASANPKVRQKLARLGISRLLQKPVKPSELGEQLLDSFKPAKSRRKTKEPQGNADGRRSPFFPMKLLLVEDTHINRVVAVKWLEDRGHSVTVAEDGMIAVEKFFEDSFDAILMDVQMPRLDGFGATAAIREAEKESGGHVPIIAMTANAIRGDRWKCLNAGMDDYIAKPINSGMLFTILEKFAPGGGAGEMDPEPVDVEKREVRSKRDFEIFDSAAFRSAFPSLDMMGELIEIFPEETSGYLEKARTALEVGDAEALHFAAHSLKGTVGVYAANRAVVSATELDDHARNGDLTAASPALQKCRRAVAQLDQALRQFKETLG